MFIVSIIHEWGNRGLSEAKGRLRRNPIISSDLLDKFKATDWTFVIFSVCALSGQDSYILRQIFLFSSCHLGQLGFAEVRQRCLLSWRSVWSDRSALIRLLTPQRGLLSSQERKVQASEIFCKPFILHFALFPDKENHKFNYLIIPHHLLFVMVFYIMSLMSLTILGYKICNIFIFSHHYFSYVLSDLLSYLLTTAWVGLIICWSVLTIKTLQAFGHRSQDKFKVFFSLRAGLTCGLWVWE